MPKKAAKKVNRVEPELERVIPLCGKCGNAMVEEEGETFCPHCQGEIDFLGDEDE